VFVSFVLILLYCLFLCFCVLDRRIRMVTGGPLLQWFSFVISKGTNSFNLKWLFRYQPVWTRPSVWFQTCMFFETDWVGVLVLDSLMFRVCWDVQVSRFQGCLLFGIVVLSISIFMIVIRLLCSKERLCLLFYIGGYWYMDLNTVLRY